MRTRAKQLIKLFLQIAVTAGLLFWVFRQESIRGQFWQTVWTARWEYLILTWLLTILYYGISSFKLRTILRQQGVEARVGTIFGASAIAALYSLVVPGILSTAAKWYILEKDTRRGSAVFSSMVYNQLSITFVTLVFGLTGLIVTNPTSVVLPEATRPWLLPIVAGVVLVLTIVVTLLLLNQRTGGWLLRRGLFWLRVVPATVRRSAEKVAGQIAIFQSAPIRFHVTILAITLAATCVVSIAIYVFAAWAANVNPPLAVLLWVSAIIYVLGRLPISLANLGVREVTLVGFLAFYGVEKSGALLMSMILFSTSIFMAGVGAAYQLAWSVGARRKREPPSTMRVL